MTPFVAAVAATCTVLGLVVYRVARARSAAARSVVLAGSVFLPATVFADTIRFADADPLTCLVAAETCTAGLMLTMAALHRGWAELLCETWLTSGCATLVALALVEAVHPLAPTMRADVDIIGVSLAMFVALSTWRGVAGRVLTGASAVAMAGFVWVRVLAWVLAAAWTAGLGGSYLVATGVLCVAYLFAAALLGLELARPSQVHRDPPAPFSQGLALVLVGLAGVAVVVGHLAEPGYMRWSVAVCAVGCVAALLCLQVLTTRRLVATTRDAQRREAYFRSLVADSTDVIAISDQQGRLEFVSPAAENVFVGLDPAALVGDHAAVLVGTSPQALARALADVGSDGRVLVEGRRGDQVVEASISRRDDRFVLSVRDVTERDEMRATLDEIAFNDPLTGLGNRARLVRDLDAVLAAGGVPCVLFVDLDGFKHINDAGGHHAGDAVLVQAASRLREAVDAGVVLGRVGGDEFVAVVEGDEHRAQVLAHRIFRALTRPFAVDGRMYQVGASIGLAVGAPGVDAEEMLQRADLAMDSAKVEHRPWSVYKPSMTDQVRARAARDHDLARQWGRHAVEMYLQPIVSTRTLAVHSVEGLMRWRGDGGTVEPPANALAFAERTGRLAMLTGWVVERILAELTADPQVTTPIAVNMPPAVLTEPGFAAGLATRVASLGIPPTRLQLELTEEAVVEQGQAGLRALKALHDEGFHLHIDDFGTGYSSLSYLVRLPVDGLKIDRSFTQEVLTSKAARSVVLGLVSLSREVGLDLVAEGVETQAEHEALVRLGVPLAQGFWYARPEPAALVTDRTSLSGWSTGLDLTRIAVPSLYLPSEGVGSGGPRTGETGGWAL